MLRAFLPRLSRNIRTRTLSIAPRNKHYMASQQPLDFYAGPLVWIDCEMTGLNPQKDKILEIAVLITNGNLDIVDDGIEFVIRTEKEILDQMDEWCTKQHGSTGLTQACLTSPHSLSSVQDAVLKYIKSWVPGQGIGVLAGSSVHADRAFLVNEMPSVVDWLHYRIVDVSSIKELHRRWYRNRPLPKEPFGVGNHRALNDIRGSIQELKWYRDNIFVPSEEPQPALPMKRQRQRISRDGS